MEFWTAISISKTLDCDFHFENLEFKKTLIKPAFIF